MAELMTTMTYEQQITALLVIDQYNDFISEGGKISSRIQGVAEANNCVSRMMQILEAARGARVTQRRRVMSSHATDGS
jgi:hypothetical protein